MSEIKTDLAKLPEAILTGDDQTAVQVTKAALGEGVDPQELITAYVMPAMAEVGKRFEQGEYFLPELLIAARATKGSLELIRPLLAQCGIEPVGRVVIGTVQGDLHDIGKSLVGSILEGSGFEVIDLGVDVPPERFVEEAKKHNADLIALSALLTTTMTVMKKVIQELENASFRDRVKVLIGGAPITQEYANDIGADGFSKSAGGAAVLARELLAV